MKRVELEKKVLSENDRVAAELREAFAANGILCLNLISSPGAGKTTLLERTLEALSAEQKVAVLTGDIQTDNDAARLAGFGYPVRQITTGGTCHLDARMVQRALADWSLEELELLLIENVGNLVCPGSYDLGEHAKVVILSVAEGDDKPLKYPGIFTKAELLLLSKTDLLGVVPFELEQARNNALKVHPGMEILEVSALNGAGMEDWHRWLVRRQAAVRPGRSS